jgi:hypothetical protein
VDRIKNVPEKLTDPKEKALEKTITHLSLYRGQIRRKSTADRRFAAIAFEKQMHYNNGVNFIWQTGREKYQRSGGKRRLLCQV